MRTMALGGPNPQRPGEIAERMSVKVTTIAPLRSSLIAKGMIYSPAHGDNAFTVPRWTSICSGSCPLYRTKIPRMTGPHPRMPRRPSHSSRYHTPWEAIGCVVWLSVI